MFDRYEKQIDLFLKEEDRLHEELEIRSKRLKLLESFESEFPEIDFPLNDNFKFEKPVMKESKKFKNNFRAKEVSISKNKRKNKDLF